MSQVFQATYSGVAVYEFPTTNVSVMRRKADGWVNATHILKVANFDKPQRTRILEREVQKGMHEKVQGGYGKYQGTWVPVERAKDIAQQYGVDSILDPLFSYPLSDSPPPPPPPKPAKSTKSSNSRVTGSSSSRRSRKTNSLPIEPSLKRGRGRPAATAGLTASKPSQSHTVNISNKMRGPHAASPNSSLSNTAGGAGVLSYKDDDGVSLADSASVSSRASSPSDFMSDSDLDAALTNGSHNERLGSGFKRRRLEHGNGQEIDIQGEDGRVSVLTDGHHHSQSLDADMIAAEYSNKLLDFFMAPDDDQIPDLLIHPPPGFKINQIIDDEGHTAFHWACAMGQIKIIESLLAAGAEIDIVDLKGHTPLVCSIIFANCYDRRTFPKVVELLRNTIFHVNDKKQTILHHIASNTASRLKLSSARYYTEIILAKVSETQPMHILTNFINKQDDNGDTALHIAARNGAKKCVKVLLSYNANPDIPNNVGKTAQEFIYEYEIQKQQHYMGTSRDGTANENILKSSSSPIYAGDELNVHGMNKYNRSNKYFLSSTPNSASKQSFYNLQQVRPEDGEGKTFNGTGPYMTASSIMMSQPHVSETAIKATQRVAPLLIEQLEDLANLYDNELKDRDADVEQVRQLLQNTKHDINACHQAINEQELLLGNEQQISEKLQQANELVNTRGLQLRKLVERSQSRDLAGLVQDEEKRVKEELQAEFQAGSHNPELVSTLANELNSLQVSRKKLVDDIIELCANAGVGEKMNDYRKLVSISCGVKFEEIDNLLDGISQALLESNEDTAI